METIIADIVRAREVMSLLKPFHTIKASLAAYAVTRAIITDATYLQLTFPIMVEVMRGNYLVITEPVVVYVSDWNLANDLARMYIPWGPVRETVVVFCFGNIFMERGHYRLGRDATSMLRLLKARGGVDKIVVHLEMGLGGVEG
ncbi:hypothetical protein HO173_010785 [Letharia columbiana]|uniref:Uncharacterized protein n=1 Tax=Letharia columbiana TaxID=112416 RepID=A0A8H6FM58_9LECA|nr:uncharacterized protein HO173_010785 [Letharia columbiana]KAF6231085.1 hypothetical protein HO173_010785 [Letharia columbiana]